MRKPVFHGCATALATPFTDSSELDLEAFERLINRQLANGVSALCVCATTGECATLSDREIETLIKTAVKLADKRVPVIAGVGRNSTEKTLYLSQMAEELSADALLAVTPYYNKTTQRGLIEHYFYIADRVKTPIIVYNVPSRTGMTVRPETYASLAAHPMICGAKEASGDISAIAEAISAAPRDFAFYSGNDDQTVPVYSLGGCGVISTVSNLVPFEMSELCRLFENGKTEKAAVLQKDLLPLISAVFAETNPIPLKAALAQMGLCREILRLPLVPAGRETREKIKNALKAFDK